MSEEEVSAKCAAACASVAGCVALCRALPAQHALAEERYGVACRQLRKTIAATLATLGHVSSLDSTQQLEAANDALLAKIEADLAKLRGDPVIRAEPPVEIQVLPQQQRTLTEQPRPQILFEDTVDNSRNTPWTPKIHHKPNAIVPLDGIDTEHPYIPEIDAYVPPMKFLALELEPPVSIKPNDVTPLHYVDTREALDQVLQALDAADEIAVDVEHHSYRTFQGITCLVQISTEAHGDFILDALALRSHLHLLNVAFTDPKKLKIFHGADSDVEWLQRDLGVYIVGLFDTHCAAVELRRPNRSLAALLAEICHKKVDKSLQLADWRVRPLSKAMLEYARSDTHNLIYLWRRLRTELIEAGGLTSEKLEAVFRASSLVARRVYRKPHYDNKSHLRLLERSGRRFDPRQLMALRLIYEWRDRVAREEDESPGYVLPNHMLLHLAGALPREQAGILACCTPTPPLLTHKLDVVHRYIMEARSASVVTTVETEPEPEVQRDSFSLTDFHRQLPSIDAPRNISIKPQTIDISEQYPAQRKSALSSYGNVEHETQASSAVKSFLTPFERYLVMKKYNELIELAKTKSSTKVIEKSAETKVPVPKDSNKKIPSEAQSEVIIPIQVVPCEKLTKGENGDPDFIHKYKKPVKRKEPAEDTSFEPFDYKGYNYQKYNKNSFDEKKRKRHRK